MRASSAATSLRCSSQCVDVRRIGGLGLPADLRHQLHRGVDGGLLALVEHQEQRLVAGLVGAVGLDGVVEAEHGGGAPSLQDPPHGVETVLEGAERVGATPLVHGGRMEAEPGAGDDAEGALRADEQLVQVWTRPPPAAPRPW